MPTIHGMPINKEDKEKQESNVLLYIAMTLAIASIALILWGILR